MDEFTVESPLEFLDRKQLLPGIVEVGESSQARAFGTQAVQGKALE